jgi:L-lactate dehydrogenase complex protein LldG
MSGDREKIMGRIREALAVPAPRHDAPARPHAIGGTTAGFREWLPAVGDTFAAQLALFSRQCDLLRTALCECADVSAAATRLAAILEQSDGRRLACHAGELNDQLIGRLPKSCSIVRIAAEYDRELLETCDAALTECEALVAQTGSVCVTSRSSGGRALSVLPPHHVVVARRAQLLSDLGAAYEQLAEKYRDGYPSFISFISGPSRTGDIERILVLGAHGPKNLTILLLP